MYCTSEARIARAADVHTKVYYIENLRCSVLRDAREQLAICACRDTDYRSKVRTIVLNELDALLLLLPQFELAVNRCCQQEVGSEGCCQRVSSGPRKEPYFVITQKFITSLCMKLL